MSVGLDAIPASPSLCLCSSQAKTLLLTQLRLLQSLRDGALPPLEAVEVLCHDDLTFSRLSRLVSDGSGEVNKKLYAPVLQVLLQSAAEKASKPTLESCVALTAVSASVVLAGSGDLDTLALLRVLRGRMDDISYGTHMGELSMGLDVYTTSVLL